MKVLHVLYQSLPQISGSSIRSRDILMSQKEVGIDVLAITSPFQPASLKNTTIDYINDIKYIRTSKASETKISDQQKPFFQRFFRFLLIFSFTIKLYKVVKKEQPDILHAHAMFFCGLPSIFVGKLLKKPVVYEFRSLWMKNKSNNLNKSKFKSFIEKILLNIEVFTLNKANCAIAINDNLKDFLINNGVKNNIVVIPNAVNTTLVNNLKNKIENIKREEVVFGYIGTITHYEGIPFLVKTFQELFQEDLKIKLLIYGTGIDLNKVITQINKQKNNNIQYMGVVNPLDIYKAFSKIDVIINPRLKSKLTDSVTPLKPLEAMAYQKIVIGSDVGGIKELVKDNYNGFLFKSNDTNDLKQVIKKVISLNKNKKEIIINNSLKFVLEQKSWLNNANIYKKIYSKILLKV